MCKEIEYFKPHNPDNCHIYNPSINSNHICLNSTCKVCFRWKFSNWFMCYNSGNSLKVHIKSRLWSIFSSIICILPMKLSCTKFLVCKFDMNSFSYSNHMYCHRHRWSNLSNLHIFCRVPLECIWLHLKHNTVKLFNKVHLFSLNNLHILWNTNIFSIFYSIHTFNYLHLECKSKHIKIMSTIICHNITHRLFCIL